MYSCTVLVTGNHKEIITPVNKCHLTYPDRNISYPSLYLHLALVYDLYPRIAKTVIFMVPWIFVIIYNYMSGNRCEQ